MEVEGVCLLWGGTYRPGDLGGVGLESVSMGTGKRSGVMALVCVGDRGAGEVSPLELVGSVLVVGLVFFDGGEGGASIEAKRTDLMSANFREMDCLVDLVNLCRKRFLAQFRAISIVLSKSEIETGACASRF